MKTMKFTPRGTFTALVTPFKKNGKIDFDAFDGLMKFQIKNGITGVAINSTTGEAPTLNEDEKMELLTRAIEIANGKISIMAGTGSYDTQKTIDLTIKSKNLGASAALIVSPYYNKPTQAHLYEHYKAIAESVDIPIVLYNVPGRTGCNITPDTQLKLAADFKNIVATKEASGNIDQIMYIIRNAPKGFAVLSGDDAITLPMLSLGGDGVVSVITNYAPKQMSTMVKLGLQGKFAQARTIHNNLYELMNKNFIESNPVPAKGVMSILGMIQPYVRMPLQSITTENRNIMRAALKRAGLI